MVFRQGTDTVETSMAYQSNPAEKLIYIYIYISVSVSVGAIAAFGIVVIDIIHGYQRYQRAVSSITGIGIGMIMLTIGISWGSHRYLSAPMPQERWSALCARWAVQ